MRRALRLLVVTALLGALAGAVPTVRAAAAPRPQASTTAPAQTAPQTATVRYGPFTIPAAAGEEHGMIRNAFRFLVAKPCSNCMLTSIKPNLVYPDGSTANVDTGPMLHHMVLASWGESDPTCGSSFLGLIGRRFFAAGNERTSIPVMQGYGIPVQWYDSWNLIYDLMNMDSASKTVYIELKFSYVPGMTLTPVTPVWFDMDQCGDSEYSIPAGRSTARWDWNVNVPGRMIGTGGHVHTEGHGLYTKMTNVSTGQTICQSNATYGGSPGYTDMMGDPWISNMSICAGTPLTTVSRGQTIRLETVYDSPEARNDVMGINIAYIAP